MGVVSRVLLAALVGLSGWPVALAKDNVITKDTHFYGQSAPVYPSPNMTGIGDWTAAYDKARALVAQMSLEEKVNLTGGCTTKTGCSGEIAPNPKRNFPGMCLSDAGQGLRNTDFVSSFPSGIHVGASWNKELAYERAAAMGREYRKKGVNVILGPVVGPLGRTVTSGRNWEGISVDPYLSGVLVSQTVQGVQAQGVIASTKHFIANEQETNRLPGMGVESVSANLDDTTMHELYLWPFQDAIKAGTGNIMCSYNRLNNSYGCANSKTLNGLLKTELGFQGFVVTDWSAQHAGVATALAGLDMTMPLGSDFWANNLTEAVKNGSVPEYRVDDMATRIMTTWYQFKQDEGFPNPGKGMPKVVTDPHEIVDGRTLADRPTLFQGAVEGHVLVKNTKNTLPLKQPRLLSLFGYSAKSPDTYDPSPSLLGTYIWGFGNEPTQHQLALTQFDFGARINESVTARNGTMISGGGSGGTTPTLVLAPFEAIKMRASDENVGIFHEFYSAEPYVHPASDACIVFGNAWASEGYDRPAVRDDYTDGLIKHVADQCEKTVVVLHNPGVRLVDQFVNHPNVTAIIYAHLPGQESGRALTSLLWGDISPSGKLPYTVAKNESDYGDVLYADQPEGEFVNFPQSNFTEGVYIDYRAFDRQDIQPRYEFGFGLSYTTFEMSDLQIQNVGTGPQEGEYPMAAVVPGGQADLWDVLYTATANVTNTGDREGAEVAQLYVGMANAPAKQLRGFDKVVVPSGGSVQVSFGLTRRDLSVWDVVAQKWRLQRGDYKVWVGSSSRDLPLEATITI